MYIILFFIVLIFIVIVLFAFPQFSPIPYFPSNKKDLSLIGEVLHLRNNQTIIDLGAGDGIVIFEASQRAMLNKLNTQFYAVEINPVLLCILWMKWLMHPNRKNIHIVKQDMFTCNYKDFVHAKQSDAITFYLYISPWFIDKTIANIRRQMKSFEIVSYFYQVKCLPKLHEELREGVHKIYNYSLRQSERCGQ